MIQSRRLFAAASLAGILALAGIAWWHFDPLEPRFEGVRVSEIVRLTAQDWTPNSMPAIAAAERQLRRMDGAVAVPALVRAHAEAGPGWETWVPRLADHRLFRRFGRYSWWNDLQDASWRENQRRKRQQDRFIELLGHCGPNAASEIPLILRHYGAGHRATAVNTLIGIGRPAVPEIHRLLNRERDVEMLRALLAGLKTIAPAEAQKTVPRLETLLLTDPDERVRAHCAEMIARLGPAARNSASALRQAQNDSWRMVREAAEQALQAIGATNAAPVLPPGAPAPR